MRFSVIALSAIFSTALAGVAYAGGPGRLIEALDLSPEQTEIVESFKDEMGAAREEVKETKIAFRDAMKAEISSGDPNTKLLQRLAEDKLDAQRDATFLAIEHMTTLSETLTDEQLETFLELQEKRQENRGEGRGPGRGEGRGGR